jgi:hypothetical protein
VRESSTFEAPHGIATMTPEQLAEHGIPATVALRARLDEAEQELNWAFDQGDADRARRWSIKRQERFVALAILEAKASATCRVPVRRAD